MIEYLSANSGITHYDFTEEGLLIKYRSGKVYHFTDSSASPQHITNMIWHATNDKGLCEYISVYRPKHVGKR
jgi:hypothetical protein